MADIVKYRIECLSIASGAAALLVTLAVNAQSAVKISTVAAANDSTNAVEPAASPLAGTLFFSDRERSQLDQIRSRPKSSAQQAGETESARSIINGYVKRADGGVTIWVDGVPVNQPDRQLAAKVGAASVGITLADVRISVADRALAVTAPPTVTKRPDRKKAALKAKTK